MKWDNKQFDATPGKVTPEMLNEAVKKMLESPPPEIITFIVPGTLLKRWTLRRLIVRLFGKQHPNSLYLFRGKHYFLEEDLPPMEDPPEVGGKPW